MVLKNEKSILAKDILMRLPHGQNVFGKLFALALHGFRRYVHDTAKLRYRQSRHPLFVSLYATTRCNRNCADCFVKSVAAENGVRDLSLPDLQHMLRSDMFRNVCYVSLGGGEATLNPQVLEIVSELTRAGIVVGTTSNVMALTDKKLADLSAAGLKWLRVSIYPDNREKISRIFKSGVFPLERIVLNYHSPTIEGYIEAYDFACSIGARHLAYGMQILGTGDAVDPDFEAFCAKYTALCKKIVADDRLSLTFESPRKYANTITPKKISCAFATYTVAPVFEHVAPCCYLIAEYKKYGTVDDMRITTDFKKRLFCGSLDEIPKECLTCPGLYSDDYLT